MLNLNVRKILLKLSNTRCIGEHEHGHGHSHINRVSM